MRKRLTLEQKKKWSLISGIMGFLVSGYMIFFLKNNWGFLPLAMAIILLVFRRK